VGGGQAGYGATDNAFATFSEYTRDTAGLAAYGVSRGYCIVVDCSNGCAGISDTSPAQLDAGSSLAIRGPSSSSMQGAGFYFAFLSGTGRFLWSDLNYTVSGTGGKDVGAFSVMTRTSLPALSLKGIKGSQSLPLSGDLTIEWTGSNPQLQNGQVVVGGYSGNDDLTQLVSFQCTAPVSPQKFTIPGWMLSSLPPSGTGHNGSLTYPQGWLWVGQYNNPTEFQAEHLDRAIMTDIFFNGLAIYYK